MIFAVFLTFFKKMTNYNDEVMIRIAYAISSSSSVGLEGEFWSEPSYYRGAQWLSGRVLDLRPRGRGFEPHRRHCVVSLSKNINPSLVLVQPRNTRPYITERLLMGR